MKYCQHCGHFLQEEILGLSYICPGCGKHAYENPVMAVEAALFDEDGRVLLGRRTREPSVGQLDLPGGFLDPHETLEDGLMRELREELAIEPDAYGPLRYAGSRVDTHTQEDNTRQVVVAIFTTSIAHRDFVPNDEVDEFVWKLSHELTPQEATSQAAYDHIAAAAKQHNADHQQ
ncbi:MAG TPA: NUDIX domain-containing protein [Candidatus Saccharimonadales bacterium]|nr:NUDIX domain-containing protein [Candidatus Saccharimonadales bacterium]